MKAVIFGPGRVGCGFAGQLLRGSGHEVVFVARNQAMVNHFNRVGRYLVRLVGQGRTEEIMVEGIRAVWTGEPDKVAREIVDAGLVSTSVGFRNLAEISPLIALGLSRRAEPVNVISFENFGTAASYMRRRVKGCGPEGCNFSGHGFSPALVSRVMSERLGDPAGNEPLVFVGDHPDEFVVYGKRLVRPIPEIKGMRVVDNYDAWFQKKLFMFSAGHATTAYLGYLKGYHYIHSAIRDPEIREAVLAAMREGQQGLMAQYGGDLAGDEEHLLEIVARFENAALNDSIDRVGRDPLRKLGKRDRLIGAARMAEKAGIEPEKLMLAVAAALYYCDQDDPSCTPIREELETIGPDKVLREVSGLNPGRRLSHGARRIFAKLLEKGPRSPLLNLEKFFWA